MRNGGTWVAMGLACALVGCGGKDEGKPAGGEPTAAAKPGGGEPAKPAAEPSAASAWNSDAVSFKARWATEGEATKKSKPSRLTGTFYVGPDAVRLDIDEHPDAGGPVTLLRTFDDDDSLWKVSAADKQVRRALSGDWEHKIVPWVLPPDGVDDVLEGDCPFGRADPAECAAAGNDTVAGRAVVRWQYKNQVLWVDATLRAALEQTYTPYRNNPGTQVIELTDVEVGAQDPSLFKVPAEYTCDSGTFCDSVPR